MKKLLFITTIGLLALGLSAQDTPATHTVGEYFGGGIVFYVTPNGQHGLVVSSTEFEISPSGSLSNLFGLLGNIDILNDEEKNFVDWRFPYFGELKILYKNKSSVPLLQSNFYVSYEFYIFWVTGKTQNQNYKYYAVNMKDGGQSGTFGISKAFIRFVRAF